MAAPLPAGWTEYPDAASGNPYFHNVASGETTWTRPSADAAAAAAPLPPPPIVAAPAAQTPLPEGWAEFFDSASNKAYFHRSATGETTWTRPMPIMGMSTPSHFSAGAPQPGLVPLGGGALPGMAGAPVNGRVKTWNDEKGFGFIIPEDGGNDIFVHRSALSDGNVLVKDTPVLYELTWSAQKNKYAAVKVMGAVNNPGGPPGGGVPAQPAPMVSAPGGFGGFAPGGMPMGVAPGVFMQQPGMPPGGGFAPAGLPAGCGGGCPGGKGGGNAPNDNLFVAGLPKDMESEKLKAIFGGYGNVADCRVLPDSGKPDRAALVRMADMESATWMVNNLNGVVPAGFGLTSPLVVRFAEPKGKGKGKGDGFGQVSAMPAHDARFAPYNINPPPMPAAAPVGLVGGLPQAVGDPNSGFGVPGGP